MQGTRLPDVTDSSRLLGVLLAGQYQKLTSGAWRACTPNGYACNLERHKVEEHEDGTITVHPSILVRGIRGDGKPAMEFYHGWLERGVWRDC